MTKNFSLTSLGKKLVEQGRTGGPKIWINPGIMGNTSFGGLVGDEILFFLEVTSAETVLIASTPCEQTHLIKAITLALELQPCFKYRCCSANQFCVEWALDPEDRKKQLDQKDKYGEIRGLISL